MNPLTFIPPQYQVLARIAALFLIAMVGASSGWLVRGWKDGTELAHEQALHAQEHLAQAKAVADQKTRNIELQRAAEKHYVVAAQGQDHFFTKTITEIRHDAAPLAACPVPDAVRVRLNAAAACARGDSPTSCFADDEVPGPQ